MQFLRVIGTVSLLAVTVLVFTPKIESRATTRSQCVILPSLISSTIPSDTGGNNESLSTAEKLQQILSEGEKLLPFEKHNKSAIFILGNTGSGKTTFSLTMNGNLSRIHAVKTHRGRLVIVDDDDFIGLPTTKSKTLVPHYVLNPENAQAFYDCPGFDDNRGVESDIAAMYFVKSITRHVTQAKFLFLVTSSSVRLGNDRLDFELLATHASTFLKNLNKLSDSIGLIITKVSNFNEIGEWNSDEEILEQVVEFLEKFQETLEERLGTYEDENDLEFIATVRKLQFLQALLRTDPITGEHNRIWFLRNPPNCGTYDQIPYVKEVREAVTNLYQNNLEYANVTENDFGFTLKTKTMLEVERSIVPSIQSEIEDTAVEMIDQLKTDYVADSLSSFEQEEDDLWRRQSVLTLQSNIDAVANILLNYDNVTESNSSTLQPKASEQMDQLFSILSRPVPEENQNKIRKREGWLEFFRNVTSGALQVDIPRPRIDAELHNFLEGLRNMKDEFHSQIKSKILPDLRAELRRKSMEILEEMGSWYINQFYDNLTDVEGMPGVLLAFDQTLKKLNEVEQQMKFIPVANSEETVILARSLNFELDNSTKILLEGIEDKLEFYGGVVGIQESDDVQDITLTTSLLERLREKRNYYDWLMRLDELLGGYNAQLQIGNLQRGNETMSLHLLSKQGIISNPQFVSELERSTASPKDKEMLEKIIYENTGEVETSCDANGTAVVKGRIVRFSNFIKNYKFADLCGNQSIKYLEVLATNKLLLDCDIPAKGMNLVMNVIGVNWDVVGPQRTISLDGSDGSDGPIPAEGIRARNRGVDGLNGVAGISGGHGGHFVGAFDSIKNGGALTITSNGGNGGPGQHGGHGDNGKNGENRHKGHFSTSNPYSEKATDGSPLDKQGFDVFAVFYGNQMFRARGIHGTRGGNGGNGGVGGDAGKPGSITIITPPGKDVRIKISLKPGTKGPDGEGGRLGVGGKHGNHMWCRKHFAVFILWWDDCRGEYNPNRAYSGRNGTSGINEEGFAPVQFIPREPLVDWSKSLENYRSVTEELGSKPGIEFYNVLKTIQP